jgi:dTMP kinase
MRARGAVAVAPTLRAVSTDAGSLDFLARLAGRFLAFEGPDGCGKSTQLRRLVEACRGEGVPVCEVREPGGTPVGERVRQVLLDKASDGMTLRCEMLLYMASRAQLVETVIRPALARGELVVADRFLASTYAYQGAGGGLAVEEIDAVARVATGGTLPDLNVIFDVDEATAARRAGIVPGKAGARRPDAGVSLFADRMEVRGMEFHRRVREGYLALAARDPGRHVVVDARGDANGVWSLLVGVLRERFGP